MYDLEEARIIEEIKKRKPSRVLLQFPEGLKQKASYIVDLIEKNTSAKAFVSSELNWGACDLPVEEARQIQADLIITFGHAPFHAVDIPVLYIEAKYNKDITPLLKKAVKILPKNIGIVASVQHIHQIPAVKSFLESEGKIVTVPKGIARSFHQGQILGCEYTGPRTISEKVDAFLSVSSKFHALGLALSVNKPVLLLNPSTDELKDLSKEASLIRKQRTILINKASNARNFGILVSTKSGQGNILLAQKLKDIIESQEKKAIILVARDITQDAALNFKDLEVFIDTACPRIATDDVRKFSKPILTFNEALVALGKLDPKILYEHGFITPPYEAPFIIQQSE